MQSSTGARFSVAIMLIIVLVAVVVMEASANPSPSDHAEVNVAEALRYLQDIESKHAQFARPRFGKRANEYLSKEYTNNFLRFMLENPEQLQQQQQQES